MVVLLPVHILAGSLGLVTGFLALFTAKGGPLHRRIGMAFVIAMLTMTATGIVVALVRNAAPAINVPAAILTAYLVTTGLTTVRGGPRPLALAGMVVAFVVGAAMLAFGVLALTHGGRQFGFPAFPFFLFGVAGTFGSSATCAGCARQRRRAARASPATCGA